MALSRRMRWGLSLTLVAFATIAWFTLRPSPEDSEAAARSSFTCLFPCGDQSLRDAILNVILFVPFGFALRLWLPAWRAWLLTLLTTCAIEFTQYSWLLGRDASLRDILTNALGGAIGVALVSNWRPLLLPDRRQSWWLTLAGGGLWLLMVTATALQIQPSLPVSTYWGQWAPELGQFDTWRGSLLDARIQGSRMATGRMNNSEPVRAELLSDSVLVEATIVTGPAPENVAPIASMFDSKQREIFVLGQRGHALVFRIRTGIRAMEMGGQIIMLDDVLGAPGDTLHIFGGVIHGRWVLAVEGRSGRREIRLPFSPGLLWTGLTPFGIYLEAHLLWLNGIWLGALLLPVGYWLRRTGATPAVIVAASLGATLALCASALLAGLSLPLPAEWVGTLLGIPLGWLVGRTAVGR